MTATLYCFPVNILRLRCSPWGLNAKCHSWRKPMASQTSRWTLRVQLVWVGLFCVLRHQLDYCDMKLGLELVRVFCSSCLLYLIELWRDRQLESYLLYLRSRNRFFCVGVIWNVIWKGLSVLYLWQIRTTLLYMLYLTFIVYRYKTRTICDFPNKLHFQKTYLIHKLIDTVNNLHPKCLTKTKLLSIFELLTLFPSNLRYFYTNLT